MERVSFVVAMIGILILFLWGCSNEEQYIAVQQLTGLEEEYEEFREIKDLEQVRKINEIVSELNWDVVVENMERPADYRFSFQYHEANIETKAPYYSLWLNLEQDTVELVLDRDNSYVSLNKKESKDLLDVLVGRESVELKKVKESLKVAEDELLWLNEMVVRDETKIGTKAINMFFHHVSEGIKDSIIAISPGIDSGPAIRSLFYDGEDEITYVYDNTRDHLSTEVDRSIYVYYCGKDVDYQYDIHGQFRRFMVTNCVGEDGGEKSDHHIFTENLK
ncbi:hypothetical protein [Lederbergia graminis]|uniref:Uncharacterized protein n=1 Tax=Lederbergia graminis TaxID=735518 RepID=A0ABW0LDN6_9BACI